MSTIECGICFLQYNENDVTPRILTSCGHTICQQCAVKLSEDGRTITCPFDIKVTQLNRNEGVNGLPKNFALLELSREANQEQEKDSGKEADVPCFENPSHEATFYCQQCEVELCDSCFTSVHKSKLHSAHRKIKISEKPIKLPECPNHPHKTAEFLCTDSKCQNPTKIMCQICVLFDQHKSHKYGFLMEKLLKNEQLLKNVLKEQETHRIEGEIYIKIIEQKLESFEDIAQRVSDELDIRKENALRKLAVHVNDEKVRQIALKQRLEDEYSKTVEVKKLTEKKLKMKNDLHNTDEIISWDASRKSWDLSPSKLDVLRGQKFIIPAMEIQI